MKKILSILLVAAAALASCTKSEVTLDHENEIGFAPASKNITKAALTGTLPTSQFLGIWAYWNGVNGTVEETSPTYADYTDSYLVNAEFANRNNSTNWGGNGVAYPWPTNGALVFAGYNKPSSNGVTAQYSGLADNTLTFSNYTQSTELSNTFDLCWFGKTASSYNNRLTSAAVPVTMSHALTWITIKVKGDAATAPSTNPWIITKATLKSVNTVGETGTCTFDNNGNASAIWTSNTPSDIIVNNIGQNLTQAAVAYESTTNGLVVIPQTPVSLEIEYQYPVSGTYKDGKSTVNLTLEDHKDENGNAIDEAKQINTWLSGTHYTYTLVFKANEILVAPSYGNWSEVDRTVTVE